jgi:tRNA (uracil-5-)-methyltransferase TRM9
MDSRTRMQLRALNRRFYERHAVAFDASRDHAWPGWQRIELPTHRDPAKPLRVLDVGCGNARFADALAERLGGGFAYTGVDENEALLARAGERLARTRSASGDLICIDILASETGETLPRGPFDLVVAFGLLHHVPGWDLRRAFVHALADRVDESGVLVVTAWQFADRSRFASHIVPESEVPAAIDPAQFEEGDHLLPFDGDHTDLRYCHHCSEAELDQLVATIPLIPRPRFSDDGRSGDLNRYLVFERSPSRRWADAI